MLNKMFRPLLVVLVLTGFQALANQVIPTKNWAWKPLFNHQVASSKLANESYASVKQELFVMLAQYLTNSEVGVDGEFISQNETNSLLRYIVSKQIKAIDLLRLLQDYSKPSNVQLNELCLHDFERCEDGRQILVSFLDVQNRVEEIETGRLDVEGLPDAQREAFLGNQFLCFYYDFQTAGAIEKFKQDQLVELKAFVKKVQVNQDRGLVQSLIRGLAGDDNIFGDKIEERPAVSEAEITAVLTGWEHRLIVARCWTKARILEWKTGFLKTSMPEVLINKPF